MCTAAQQAMNEENVEQFPQELPRFDDSASLLRYVYADLTRIEQIASNDIVLHPADRSISCGLHDEACTAIRGIRAVQAYEERLVAATGGTLMMEIDSIATGTLWRCARNPTCQFYSKL